MNNQQAYNIWADTYDSVINTTRDLEARALRAMIAGNFDNVLEIGCGTGKNTEWLMTRSLHLTGTDFSEVMLFKAKEKIKAANVAFKHTDIRNAWNFPANHFDLVTCSLVLEHIANIHFVFAQALSVLKPGGLFYIGELHPFKQYMGSKARFETANGISVLDCFIHSISDYFHAGTENQLRCIEIKEWFDDDKTEIPRLITMIFQK